MGSKPSGISGSRAATILNLNKWATPVDAWLKIMEERKPGFCKENNFETPIHQENAAMAWGLAMENKIIELASREYGSFISCETFEKEFVHPDYGFITCHVDGIFDDGCIHEGKTTNSRTFYSDWGQPEGDGVPAYYKAQVQHQMLLAGSPCAIVSVLVFPKMQDEFGDLDPNMHDHWADTLYEMGYFHQYAIEANPELHEMMIEIYKEFWERYVIGETPPDPVEYEDIRKLVRDPIGTIVADDDIYRLSQTYKQITNEVSQANKQKGALKTQILSYMKKQAEKNAESIDDDSREKWVLRDQAGRKLHQFDGRKFR